MSTDYAGKIELIEHSLGKRPKTPDGRYFERYEHGFGMRRGRKRYLIKYQWSKMYAHHMTGRVYEAVLGVGDDFYSALADAVSSNAQGERCR